MLTTLLRFVGILVLAGCATSSAPVLPVLAQSYVLVDDPSSTEASTMFPNVTDARTNLPSSRVETARGVVLSDRDFQSAPVAAVRTEFLAFARSQWKAEEKIKALAAKEVRLTDFTLSYTAGPPDTGKMDLSMGPAVGAFDLMMRGAFGQIGDFRLSVAVVVEGTEFRATEVAQYGANGGLVPAYASRWLVNRTVRNIAAQILAHNASKS